MFYPHTCTKTRELWNNPMIRVRFPLCLRSGLRPTVCVAWPEAAPISLSVQTYEHIPFINSHQHWGKTLQPWTWPKNQKAHHRRGLHHDDYPHCACLCLFVCKSHNRSMKGKWLVLMLPREIPRLWLYTDQFSCGLRGSCFAMYFIIACVYIHSDAQQRTHSKQHCDSLILTAALK